MIAFGNSIAAFAGLAGHDPEAIVLDFVQPDGAGRWPAGIIAMAIVRYPLILKVDYDAFGKCCPNCRKAMRNGLLM
jgi:hypothetical protein